MFYTVLLIGFFGCIESRMYRIRGAPIIDDNVQPWISEKQLPESNIEYFLRGLWS